ncbi:DUF2336 domain-containing protein [Pseudorhodoplanes sp.]|uniref:DUF2336 domain-containing protein n=1 Tax=Pseudorhodoplanes sp. TaxID=1934341 RepID=UPI002CF381F7|nr:DUF2336 domain-containing protein [Pseudorhodoplanes sp.]HWV40201.1 DUF2336 domain-containing protein [Pseudorhodoplanes sp.]
MPARYLLELASHRSSDKRLELLRIIAESFAVANEPPTPTIKHLLSDIVGKLLTQINPADRAQAAASLAKMDQLPDHVVSSLIHDDDIAVAGPIIRDYRKLSDRTMADVAHNGPQSHLEALAERDGVRPAVTDILVQRGEGPVLRKLACNSGATLSRQGMRVMIGKAASDPHLQEALVGRNDLSLEAVGQLLSIVSQSLVAKLRSAEVQFNPAVVQDQGAGWMSDRTKNVAQINRSIQRVRACAEKLDDVLMAIAVERRLLDLATLIAGVCDLDRDYGFNLVAQGRTDSLIVLLRALGVGWPVAERVLTLRIDKLGSEFCGPMIDEATYESVEVDVARRAIHFLKVRRAALLQQRQAVA